MIVVIAVFVGTVLGVGLALWLAPAPRARRSEVVLRPSADHYLDPGAVRSRSGTPQGVAQYVVTLTRPTGAITLTEGPSASTARQVFENVVPGPDEVMTFTDGGVERGVKRGDQ